VPSPFPGMNPYLEQESVWQDFHVSFIPTLREILNRELAPNYVVKVEEYVFIHELPAEQRRAIGRADLIVGDKTRTQPTHAQTGVMTAPAYAFIPAVAVDEERHPYLSVIDRTSKQVITVIELLSPSNKNHGGDHDDYLKKRRNFFSSGIHVLEIDLLRGGPRLPFDDLPNCDYLIAVSRAEERPRVEIWPLGLRDPLPVIPVPLRAPDADAPIDLKQALDRAYDAAGYAKYIYEGAPQPPLILGDAVWARQFLP
jgi:hypothetical protein